MLKVDMMRKLHPKSININYELLFVDFHRSQVMVRALGTEGTVLDFQVIECHKVFVDSTTQL